jgi:hypothetical protein
MKAEPMMPKMSVTPLATMVSTKASEGVIFCTPLTTVRVSFLAELMGFLLQSIKKATQGVEGIQNFDTKHSKYRNLAKL